MPAKIPPRLHVPRVELLSLWSNPLGHRIFAARRAILLLVSHSCSLCTESKRVYLLEELAVSPTIEPEDLNRVPELAAVAAVEAIVEVQTVVRAIAVLRSVDNTAGTAVGEAGRGLGGVDDDGSCGGKGQGSEEDGGEK